MRNQGGGRVLLSMCLKQDTGARVPECGGERRGLWWWGWVQYLPLLCGEELETVWSWKFWEGRGSVATGFGGKRAWTWKGRELGSSGYHLALGSAVVLPTLITPSLLTRLPQNERKHSQADDYRNKHHVSTRSKQNSAISPHMAGPLCR